MICAGCKNIVPAGRTTCLVCGRSTSSNAAINSALPDSNFYVPQNTSRAFMQGAYTKTRNWILGIVGGIILLIVIAWIVLFSPGATPSPLISETPTGEIVTLDPSALEVQIHDDLQAQGSGSLVIDCPSLMEGVQGTDWQCVGEDSFGTRYLIDVRLQNALGEVVWVLQP
jgi:hypothetical protein